MRTRRRRRLDRALLVVGALVVGVVAAVGAAVGDDERITGLWAGAEVRADGGARIVEVIDYDFGVQQRHGIFRDVPGLAPGDPVEVASPTAPDEVDRSGGSNQSRIRIGDPERTISGRHRYTIRYPLAEVAPDGRLAWDAVGTAWPVAVGRAELHVVAPYVLDQARCVHGGAGSDRPCRVAQPQPGHLVAEVDGLGAGEGVTLYAVAGRRLEAAPGLPPPPSGAAADPGTGLLWPALLAIAAALLGAVPAAWLVRRAGRERVAPGGAAEAAWAATGGEVRVDAEDLASLATTEFAPPAELSAAQGGVVLAEAVGLEHKLAWLIGAAVDGYLELEGDGDGEGRRVVTLVRLPRRDGSAAYLLDLAFAGRERLPLGTYDASFARAWEAVGNELSAWQRSSGLWDPGGDRRRTGVRVLGAVAALAGLAGGFLGGLAANRWGPAWLPLAAAGALLAGAGWAAALTAWELRVRTPAGSGLWLRVESFRRFLAASEARHADEAAKRGVLREYTAWAVAVGEVDRWSRAVAASTAAATPAAGFSIMAPWLWSATAATATEPKASRGSGGGGGGSGGGGVGGGAGGGGGGSW
jgi:uncharacterized membrane protein YgcG